MRNSGGTAVSAFYERTFSFGKVLFFAAPIPPFYQAGFWGSRKYARLIFSGKYDTIQTASFKYALDNVEALALSEGK